VSGRLPLDVLPQRVWCCIEVPRGGHVKRAPGGQVEFVSPWPCPFNYGSVEGVLGTDGDPQDVVVLGPPLAVGGRTEGAVLGRALFLDRGLVDDKWICAAGPLAQADRQQIEAFFSRYARVKAGLGAIRGRRGTTRFEGLELRSQR
jgi:inorganic pyrophosphatase